MMASSLVAAFRGQPAAAGAKANGEAAPAPADGAAPSLGFDALLRAILGGATTALPSDEGADGAPGSATGAGAASTDAGDGSPGTDAATAPPSDGKATPVGWISVTRPGSRERDGEATEATDGVMPALGAQAAAPTDAAGVPEAGETDQDTGDIDAAEGTSTVSEAQHRHHDVRTADRALSHLAPELQSKVERVIQRMAEERGEHVVLVEGYRTPERQAYLYGQGRSRPGPVVTWTTDSRHSQGMAADLKVEGPWSQRASYVALQRIAREEGLTTLGMKDPGHVELPAGEAPVVDAPESAALAVTDPDLPLERHGLQVARVARTARVAGAARAARPASVARPARVAVPGAPARATDHTVAPAAVAETHAARHTTPTEAEGSPRGSNPAARGTEDARPVGHEAAQVAAEAHAGREAGPSATGARARPHAPSVPGGDLRVPVAATADGGTSRTRDGASKQDAGSRRSASVDPVSGAPVSGRPVREASTSGRLARGGRDDRSRRDGGGPATPARADGRGSSDVTATGGSPAGTHGGGVRAAAPTPSPAMATPADALHRVEQAMELRDALGATPSNRVSVRLDGTAGPVSRVQVDLADTTVRGMVDVDDPRLAIHLRDSRQEVVRALSEKGFDLQEMAVRMASNRSDAVRGTQEAGWAGLRLDGAAGALRAMISGDGAGAQDRSSQGQHRNLDGWHDGRQQNGSNNRSREEQRRERR